MVDLAIFDPDHDHVTAPHVQVYASEMVHDHDVEEINEHESLGDMSMHVSFHTLLSLYISAPSLDTLPLENNSSTFNVYPALSIKNTHSRPPVPPPLT